MRTGTYITDADNGIVARVVPGGSLTVVAGNGVTGYSGDGGPAVNASLGAPTGVVVDSAGNIYFCENSNFRIRRVSPNGTITTVGGNGVPGFLENRRNGYTVVARRRYAFGSSHLICADSTVDRAGQCFGDACGQRGVSRYPCV